MSVDILGTSCNQCRSTVKSLRPRKPEGSLGRTAQDVHLDSHTAPELCVTETLLACFHVALRPRRRNGLLGTGTELEGDERVKARPRQPPEKDRRDRGPPPEQWKC